MGVGPTVFVATMIGCLVLVGGVVLGGVIRDRARARRSMARAVDEQIAAAEQTYRTELRAAPVIGVPYVAVTDDGSHDLYPHMSDAARGVCIGYLETLLPLPAATGSRRWVR